MSKDEKFVCMLIVAAFAIICGMVSWSIYLSHERDMAVIESGVCHSELKENRS